MFGSVTYFLGRYIKNKSPIFYLQTALLSIVSVSNSLRGSVLLLEPLSWHVLVTTPWLYNPSRIVS